LTPWSCGLAQFSHVCGGRGKRRSLPTNDRDIVAAPFLRRKVLLRRGAQSERCGRVGCRGQAVASGSVWFAPHQMPPLCYPRRRASLSILGHNTLRGQDLFNKPLLWSGNRGGSSSTNTASRALGRCLLGSGLARRRNDRTLRIIAEGRNPL